MQKQEELNQIHSQRSHRAEFKYQPLKSERQGQKSGRTDRSGETKRTADEPNDIFLQNMKGYVDNAMGIAEKMGLNKRDFNQNSNQGNNMIHQRDERDNQMTEEEYARQRQLQQSSGYGNQHTLTLSGTLSAANGTQTKSSLKNLPAAGPKHNFVERRVS